MDSPANQDGRGAGLVKVLHWLAGQPGATWQEKWLASGAEQAGNTQWRQLASRHLRGREWTGRAPRAEFLQLGRGLLPLLGADIVRPSLAWLLTPGSIKHLVPEMARSRDRAGFTRLEELAAKDPANTSTKGTALRRIAALLAARGGTLTDIAVGDCLEVVDCLSACGMRDTSLYFYQMLHASGRVPGAAPASVRIFTTRGQLTPGELIGRYELACRPVRDLLVEYLQDSSRSGLRHAAGNGAHPGQIVLARPGGP